MSPSSLIFVAVIAIWTTYLVVHVARRREYLATARTVDRFSTQMRVLQRRSVRVAAQPPPAYADRPSSRPLRTRPLVAATSAESFVVADFGAQANGSRVAGAIVPPGSVRQLGAVPTAIAHAEVRDVSAPVTQQATQVQTTPGPVDAQPAPSSSLPAAAGPPPVRRRRRRVRVCVLLVAALTTMVTAVLAGVGMVPWFAPVAGVAATVAVLRWLRVAALTERAAERRAASITRREQQRSMVQAREAALQARPGAPVLPVAQEHVEPRTQVYDDRAEARTQVLTVADTSVMTVVDPLLQDREWVPTPVPPPTYTLKARAERPLPQPLEVPVPIEVDDEQITWDERRHQPRAVNG